MNLKRAAQIAASGMAAQRLRLNLISSNLANAHTTRTEEGGPYKRKDAIFMPTAMENESSSFDFGNIMQEAHDDLTRGVKVVKIQETADYKLMYDPYHPDSSEEGYVQMPNINVVEEMVDLLSTSRSYEASVQAMRAMKTMAEEALKIG